VDDTLKQLKGQGFEAVGAVANVSKLEDIQNIVQLAVSSYGGHIDVVVSNAAVYFPPVAFSCYGGHIDVVLSNAPMLPPPLHCCLKRLSVACHDSR